MVGPTTTLVAVAVMALLVVIGVALTWLGLVQSRSAPSAGEPTADESGSTEEPD